MSAEEAKTKEELVQEERVRRFEEIR